GARLAALDRADARRGAGRDAGDRQGRCDQCGAARRVDPVELAPRAAREAPRVPRDADAGRPSGTPPVTVRPSGAHARVIPPGSALGVLGSGQLGRMFTIAARRMGYRVHTFSPDEDTPTGQV